MRIEIVKYIFIFLLSHSVINDSFCQEGSELSDCVTSVNNLFDIREQFPISDGNSIQVRVKHNLGKSAVIVEKLNDSLRVINKRQIVLRGDFINFFTYDFKDVEVLVNDTYCYILLCSRNEKVLTLHAIGILLSSFEDVSDHRTLTKMNNGKIYDTNIRFPYDGYFLVNLDKYSNLLITSVEARQDVFKKKTSKLEFETKVRHSLFDCKLNEIWTVSISPTYYSEFEILPGIISSNNTYSFISRNTPLNTSYKYEFEMTTLDLETGVTLGQVSIPQPIEKTINELKIFYRNESIYLAGSYYRENHKSSAGLVLGQFSIDGKSLIQLNFEEYGTEEIISASYFNSEKVGKVLSKGRIAELPHFTVEHFWFKNDIPVVVGRYIKKKSSHHFRHKYIEHFEGRNRDQSNNESLSDGTIGVFTFDSDLSNHQSDFICRDFNLPTDYMRTHIRSSDDGFELLYNEHSLSNENEKFTVNSSSELKIKNGIYSIKQNAFNSMRSINSREINFFHSTNDFRMNQENIIFQTIRKGESCIRIGNLKF